MALMAVRISALTFSRASARCSCGNSRRAIKRGRSSAPIASSRVCCSALSCNSVTSRSRIAAIPPPGPPPCPPAGAGCASAWLNQLQVPGEGNRLPVLLPAAGALIDEAGAEAGAAAGSTPAIRTRKAALGTFNTLSRTSVTTRTLAVMPGSRRPPALENPTTAT